MSFLAAETGSAEHPSRPGRFRGGLLLVLLAGWTVLVGWRLIDLQVVQYEEFAERASRQHYRVVELDAPRGTIFDARGRELAVSLQVDSAYAVPHEVPVEERAATAASLAEILPGAAPRYAEKLEKGGSFVWLHRKLDHEVGERLRALELPGVHFLEESRRYYPQGRLAAKPPGACGYGQPRALPGLSLPMNRAWRDKRRGARSFATHGVDVSFHRTHCGRALNQGQTFI